MNGGRKKGKKGRRKRRKEEEKKGMEEGPFISVNRRNSPLNTV